MPLARRLAARYAGGAEPFDDLVQVASVGLVKALDRFDPERGTAFSTFAVPTILGELKRHFRDRGWSVHVPRDVQERILKVERAMAELPAKLGHSPTIQEIGHASGPRTRRSWRPCTPPRATTPFRWTRPRRWVMATSPGPLRDRIGSEDLSFETVEYGEAIGPVLQEISERDRKVLHLRFVEDMTQSEIADRVGVSQMHVSRILRATVEKLRQRIPQGGALAGGTSKTRNSAASPSGVSPLATSIVLARLVSEPAPGTFISAIRRSPAPSTSGPTRTSSVPSPSLMKIPTRPSEKSPSPDAETASPRRTVSASRSTGELGTGRQGAHHPGEHRPHRRARCERDGKLAGGLDRHSVVGGLRRDIAEADRRAAAPAGSTADLEAVREGRDQGEPEPERRLAFVRAGVEAVPLVGDRDFELVLVWNGADVKWTGFVLVGVQDDVVARLGDHGLQVGYPGAGEAERLAKSGDRLANHHHVLGGGGKGELESALCHAGDFPESFVTSEKASSLSACTGSSARRPVTSSTRFTASAPFAWNTAKPISASARTSARVEDRAEDGRVDERGGGEVDHRGGALIQQRHRAAAGESARCSSHARQKWSALLLLLRSARAQAPPSAHWRSYLDWRSLKPPARTRLPLSAYHQHGPVRELNELVRASRR